MYIKYLYARLDEVPGFTIVKPDQPAHEVTAEIFDFESNFNFKSFRFFRFAKLLKIKAEVYGVGTKYSGVIVRFDDKEEKFEFYDKKESQNDTGPTG